MIGIEGATKEYKLYFMSVARRICSEWQVRDKELVNKIFEWCMFHKGELDYNKGLWLYGEKGKGKSTLLRIVERYRGEIMGFDGEGKERGSFTMTPMTEVKKAFEDGESVREFTERLAQAFIGVEKADMGALEFVISERYHERCWNVTHVTSELGIDDLSVQIQDKCRKMFNFVKVQY